MNSLLRLRESFWLCLVLIALTSMTNRNLSGAGEVLLVGSAETDITPPQGFPIAGYYHERLAEGTIDPLKAKAIVFEQGDQKAAMVVCDLTAISRDLCEAVRKKASESTGIPASNIAISGTHSHTAPDYSKHLYQYLEKSHVGKATENTEATPYAAKLIEGVVDAITQAKKNLSPTAISVGAAVQTTPVSFNRRFIMKDGSTQTWKSFKDPNVVRSAGPIDPEIGVATFTNATGKVQAVLSNFALHLDTVGGLSWSADYPYFVEQGIRKAISPDVISIFGTGCCGDINHANPNGSDRNKTDFIGKALASTIESTLPKLTKTASNKLAVRSKTVQLPLQEIDADQLDRSRQLLRLIQGGSKVDFLEQVTAYKTVMLAQFRSATQRDEDRQQIGWGLSHAWRAVGDALPVDVQTICIGDDLAIVFLPGEVFVELGLAIKQGSPYRHTMVIELSNCVETAYIPTRAACVGGSYEVTNSTVKPGAGELLVEAALQLLKK